MARLRFLLRIECLVVLAIAVCILGVTALSLLVLADHEYEDLTMGILVDTAATLVGIQISPPGGEPPVNGAMALGDVDGDGDLDAVLAARIIGGSLAESMDTDGAGYQDGDETITETSWGATIETPDGAITVRAEAVSNGTEDVFTYQVTNLSYEPDGSGIGALAISLATEPTTTAPPLGWNASEAIGTLGGFLTYLPEGGQGIEVGESATFCFSLPSPPAGDPPTPAAPEMRYPPSLLLSGSAEFAAGVIHLRDESNSNIPHPSDFRKWRFRDLDWEDCDFVLHGMCIQGMAVLEPGKATFAFEVSTSDAYRGPLGGAAIVTPIRPGARVNPQPPGSSEWNLEAPDLVGPFAGFGVFTSPPSGPRPGQAVILGLSVDGGESW